jgi:hypothetical protein
MGGSSSQPTRPPDSPPFTPAGGRLGAVHTALVDAYRSRVTWEFPARDELRLQAYLFTAAALYCAMVALLTRARGRARIAYMAGVIHSIAAASYMLMVRCLAPAQRQLCVFLFCFA